MTSKVIIVVPDGAASSTVETEMARITNDDIINDKTGITIGGDRGFTSSEVTDPIQAVIGAAPYLTFTPHVRIESANCTP